MTARATDANSLPDAGDPSASGEGHPGGAALQEKAAIDAGLTGDKVAHTDLAASPLGTDDEAGGAAAGSDRAETRTAGPQTVARDPNRANERPPSGGWVWIVLAVVGAALLAAALLLALV